MKLNRGFLLLLPVALGVAVAAWLFSMAEPPDRVEQDERNVTARILRAELKPVNAIVRGYGNVHAARSWESISEVAGAIIWRNAELDTGNILLAGTTALIIDPTVYELAVAQALADLAAVEIDITQLDTEEANTGRLLALEQSRLDLTRTELSRIRNLAKRGITSQSTLDGQERATLQAQRVVAELQNSQRLIPSRRNRLDAQMARMQAVLDRANRELTKTEIIVPFDLRVGVIHVEQHQFVTTGQPLVTADDIAQAEITTQIPMASFRRLIGNGNRGEAQMSTELANNFDKVSVEVRLVSDPSQTWIGRLVRVENALDPQARSVPAVVTVDAPYANANPPLRLPLVPNMYVELLFEGPEISENVMIPDSAVHGGNLVYLRDKEGRLVLREVSVSWRQGGQAIIENGIEPGEEVILDDLVPAIPGIIVIPAGEEK